MFVLHVMLLDCNFGGVYNVAFFLLLCSVLAYASSELIVLDCEIRREIHIEYSVDTEFFLFFFCFIRYLSHYYPIVAYNNASMRRRMFSRSFKGKSNKVQNKHFFISNWNLTPQNEMIKLWKEMFISKLNVFIQWNEFEIANRKNWMEQFFVKRSHRL